jgi:hypothetical protein
MSNFSTLGLITEGEVGTAPARFIGSTPDALATILAAGYLNDINKKIKANDRFDINYLDTSTFPLNTGEASIFASFSVQYDPVAGNWNLIQLSVPQSTIAALGVHSANYSNGGGSATTTITDSEVSANSVVIARWKSSANSARVETVAPANGSLVVVSSTDPGVSVLEYISILPSTALQNAGAFAGKYSYAGGSATIVIPNANITAAMTVNVNFQSQANAAYVLTAIAGAGTITVVANTNPGVSVIEYQAVLPSSALTTAGLYGATYSNAGGSATITITDATIVATSIVTADFATQANTASIYKVTPAAGSLVILASADPGVSTLTYNATPATEGAPVDAFLPLAGGQLTGSVLMDRGTATSTAGAATVNHQAGVITTESLTTAAASAYAFTLTNSRITTSSIVLLMLMGGTNTTRGIELRAIPGTGSATLSLYNNNVAGTALNGTLIFGFVVI